MTALSTNPQPGRSSKPLESDPALLTIRRLKRRLAFQNRQIAVLRARLQEIDGSPSAEHAGDKPPGQNASYLSMVRRIRDIVHEQTPPGSRIIVVSKGDDALLRFEQGREASHFPQNQHGTYAGHHPAHSEAAIEHLEKQRSGGGEFLVFPATTYWWLSYYSDFGSHLRTNYTAIFHDEESCAIFDLRKPPQGSPAGDSDPAKILEYREVLRQIQELVELLLPENAVVAVVSRGDPGLLDLGSRTCSHFPSDPGGAFRGHPATGREAIQLLREARRAGAQYLLFPSSSSWWLEYYADFHDFLRSDCRLVLHQPHACTIFEL
jgi:hypothetical protein